MSKKIAVLAGGNSEERLISLESGQFVFNALKLLKYDAEIIDPKTDDLFQLKKFDAAFICLHGKNGEDGKIQSFLELIKVPYTGSNPQASMLSMNKFLSKLVWLKHELLTPKYEIIQKDSTYEDIVIKIDSPFVVKPSSSGSSFGISLVKSKAQFELAIHEASKYDSLVIAEQYIKGREFTVSILDDQPLGMLEIIPKNEFYDYDAKYISDETTFLQPKDLSHDQLKNLYDSAIKAFSSIGCRGWGRVDFIMDSKASFYLIEINTVPGMTGHSLFPLSAKNAGLSFEQVVKRILNLIE